MTATEGRSLEPARAIRAGHDSVISDERDTTAPTTPAPALWLLDMASAPGGAALTQAHALSRAVVREAAERWPGWWDADLFGVPHREADLRVLGELREQPHASHEPLTAPALRRVHREGWAGPDGERPGERQERRERRHGVRIARPSKGKPRGRPNPRRLRFAEVSRPRLSAVSHRPAKASTEIHVASEDRATTTPGCAGARRTIHAC